LGETYCSLTIWGQPKSPARIKREGDRMKQCQTVVSIGSPARLVPSCVCAMDTDSPGLCANPEFRGWLGGCVPELCPWKKGHLDEEVKNND